MSDGLLQFVNDELFGGSAPPMDADTPLLEDGRLDSLKLLRLMVFLEERSGRKISDELIEAERFRTVRVIARNFLSS